MTVWTCGLRGVGILLAAWIGILILRKMRRWRDPALAWLLAGLSIGPILLLTWNTIYRLCVADYLSPLDRLESLGNLQVRYLYEMLNQAMNFLCVGVVLIGITKLYRNARERFRLVAPKEFQSNDPRS